jgi:hypothetical protein
MISIPARWSAAVRCALVLLLMLGASSCDKDHPVNPKKTRPVPCDTTVTVDATKGPQPDSVYLCEYDTLTWVKGTGTNSFVIQFKGNSPFADNAKNFNEQDAAHKAKSQYGPLEVDKYSITVNSTNTFDPQVVTGGNP